MPKSLISQQGIAGRKHADMRHQEYVTSVGFGIIEKGKKNRLDSNEGREETGDRSPDASRRSEMEDGIAWKRPSEVAGKQAKVRERWWQSRPALCTSVESICTMRLIVVCCVAEMRCRALCRKKVAQPGLNLRLGEQSACRKGAGAG